MRPPSIAPIIDDPQRWKTLDRSGMLGLVSTFPQQCTRAVDLASGFRIRPGGRYQNVVYLGVGSSAAGGDLLSVMLEADGEGAVPVIVTRDYRCPHFVGPNTLCIAASYSGDSEETLAAARDALQRSATLLPVTTGGALAALATERGLAWIQVPGGQPPRTALGYLFLPALIGLSRYGLCRDFTADIQAAIRDLTALAAECSAEVETSRNPAKRLAAAFHKTLPVIYGSGPVTGSAAFRWKCQFNENAKMQALCGSLPDLEHNEICGWRSARRQGKLRWLFLRDREDPERLAQCLEATRSVLASESIGYTDVWGVGTSLLARVLTLILLGDYVTTYAALLNETDPGDTWEADQIKTRLQALPFA